VSPLEAAALAHRTSPWFATAFHALIISGASLLFIAAVSRWALGTAYREHRSQVLPALWMSLGSMVGSAVTMSVNGVLALSRHICVRGGPPDLIDPVSCRMSGVADLFSVVGCLLFLASFVVWAPWRGPWRLQVFRALHGVTGSVAFWTMYLVASG
jgi:hypothetical protein